MPRLSGVVLILDEVTLSKTFFWLDEVDMSSFAYDRDLFWRSCFCTTSTYFISFWCLSERSDRSYLIFLFCFWSFFLRFLAVLPSCHGSSSNVVSLVVTCCFGCFRARVLFLLTAGRFG